LHQKKRLYFARLILINFRYQKTFCGAGSNHINAQLYALFKDNVKPAFTKQTTSIKLLRKTSHELYDSVPKLFLR